MRNDSTRSEENGAGYFSKQRIDERCSDISQLASVRESVLDNGPGRGVRVVDVDNGTGIQLTISIDRGMDLGRCTFRGVPVAFQTPTGISHPSFYDPRGINWLRTWGGGLMTGTGLRNVGAPQPGQQNDDPLGLHGRLSHTPARLMALEEKWEDNTYAINVRGRIREASFFGDTLVLERSIRVESISNTVFIHDRVSNDGPRPSPFMILYHFNFGYPFLDDSTRIVCEVDSLEPRDETAEAHLKDWHTMAAPTQNYAERCYYPDIREHDGQCGLALVNPEIPFEVELEWEKQSLPFATIWKMLGTREYALGIEPANCHPDGQTAERERGTLDILQPGESRELDVRLRFIDR